MKYWTSYKPPKKDIRGRKNKYDNNIYTFDIETTSYIVLGNKIYDSEYYLNLNEEEQKSCLKQSTMYIWQFSINDIVYYGRTWDEFKKFLERLYTDIPERKIVFVHNLSFEFEYLISVITISDAFARKSRHVIKCTCDDYNIEFRCSYYMSNCKLEKLAEIYQLDVKKQVGDLNYRLIRNSLTPLNANELRYCEYDCLVVYEYIKKELLEYETVSKIPITSTGHVRKELRDLTQKDYNYKYKVRESINTDPKIYQMLNLECFSGGYTHGCFLYTGEIIKNVDSWDFTSSYPFCLCCFRYPSTKFKKCFIKDIKEMSSRFAYLMRIKLTNVKCKGFNTFISLSKCRNVLNGVYDNGRIISADELETTINDVDLKLFLMSYEFDYEIEEIYYSLYKYLPKQLINFILDKYVKKTTYKGVEGKELEYQLEKARFNAIYGMCVTNVIKNEVIFENNEWKEIPISNKEIIEKLQDEEKKAFLSSSYGVWCTSYARYNLISNIVKLDNASNSAVCLYSDTDSIKVKSGYDKTIIDDYNKEVIERLHNVSRILNIPYEKFAPKDINGKERPLGVFDFDGHYESFIHQGAKKYAVVEKDKDGIEKIKITVAGVPKSGAKALKSLKDFNDDFVFDYKYTKKLTIVYNDNQEKIMLKDYLGNELEVSDKTGCCLLPTSYTLGKSLEYANLLSDWSSERAIYREE